MFDLNSAKDYRMVVLECPYDQLDDPVIRDLFAKVISLKIAGYRPHYGYGVLPVDATDYVGTHLLICRLEHGGLVPVTGCRTITLERSERHGLQFPGLSLVQSAAAPEHVEAVRDWIAESRTSGASLTYASSWTVSPEIPPESKALRNLLRSMFEAIHVLHHVESGLSRIIVGGTIRFRTDEVFRSWGHDPLELRGRVLGNIRVPTLLGEEVAVMTMRSFNAETLSRVERWRGMWNDRLTFKGLEGGRSARRAA